MKEGSGSIATSSSKVCRPKFGPFTSAAIRLPKVVKDRKGRKLTYDDLTHYQRIVSALNETMRLTSEIDTVIEEGRVCR